MPRREGANENRRLLRLLSAALPAADGRKRPGRTSRRGGVAHRVAPPQTVSPGLQGACASDANPLRSASQMNLQECPCARSLRAPLAVLLACLVLLAAGCSNPEKAKAEHDARGEAFLKERRWQEASLEFRNAIQIDENLAAAHWGLAQAYEQLGRGSEYIEELQRSEERRVGKECRSRWSPY